MTAPRITFDHLVVAAATLDTGIAWVEERLSVTVPHGGAHEHMATHNCVGRIGDDIYLEIIATNPDATPDRSRWFSMDTPGFQQRLNHEGAFLHHWAVASSDIKNTLAAATHAPGDAMAMSRGDLHWQISVRDDGLLARDGLIPTVIQWPDIPHPSRNMVDLNLNFEGLELRTVDVKGTTADLLAIGAQSLVSVISDDANTLKAKFNKDGKTLEL